MQVPDSVEATHEAALELFRALDRVEAPAREGAPPLAPRYDARAGHEGDVGGGGGFGGGYAGFAELMARGEHLEHAHVYRGAAADAPASASPADAAPLSAQPIVVADMGCGDGTLLQTVFLYIRRETIRGQHLDEYPLTMVGVDFNADSLRETGSTLTAAGVPHGLMLGDVGDPLPMQQQLEET